MWWFLVVYITFRCVGIVVKFLLIMSVEYPRTEEILVIQDLVSLVTQLCFLFWVGYLFFTGSY